jgi:hypothetical protein
MSCIHTLWWDIGFSGGTLSPTTGLPCHNRAAASEVRREPGRLPVSLRLQGARASDVELQVPIVVHDEMDDEIIDSTGMLDLASGEIHQLKYQDYDAKLSGLPADREDYEFTCGTLSNNGKDVEFRVEVNILTGRYSVSASELLEIKVRAAKLFAGVGKHV